MSFITKLNITSNINQIVSEFENIICNHGWGDKNQIGLNSRPGAQNIWHDAAGSLYDEQNKIFIASENDFSQWNLNTDSYIKQQLEVLKQKENTTIGRCRFMKLMPKTGLSVHKDMEIRYHYVLKTNPKSYICVNQEEYTNAESSLGIFFHIPADEFWYKVDTRMTHWVYNGGNTERIHLVVCGT